MPQIAAPTCSICGDSFSVRVYGPNANASHRSSLPVLLHCGHTFCESCMVKEAQKLKKAISCPKCKETTQLKGVPGTVKCLWPDVYLVGSIALHKKHSLDEHMTKLVNAVGQFDAAFAKKKETKKEETCSECCDKPATCRCLQCDNSVMCQGCFQRIHQASRNLRKHQAIPLYETDKFAPVPKVCTKHENRPIEFFCEDDQALICSHCVIVGDHQSHNISAMEEKNKQALEELEPAMVQAELVLHCLKKSDRGLRGVIPQVQKDIFQVFDTVRSHFNHLHSLLQTREMALMNMMDEMIQKEIGPIKDMKMSITDEVHKLESILKDAHNAKQSQDYMMNTQFLLEQLKQAVERPCFLSLDRTGDQVLFDFDKENFSKMMKDYGKLEGSACVKVTLNKLSDVPPEQLEPSVLRAPSPSESAHSLANLSADVSRTVSREPSEADTSELDDRESVHSETSSKSKESAKHKVMKMKAPEIQIGVAELVYLTHIKTPCCFAAQKMADIDKIRSLCQQINKYCNMPATDKAVPDILFPEDIVLAQFSVDGRWYRGRVGTVSLNTEEPLESRARVTFIDYGNSEEMPFKRIRKIEKRFLRIPPFAIICSLIDLVPTDGSEKWTERASQAMAKMAADKPMLMTVYGEKEGTYLVDLCKPASNSMADDQPISMRDALVFQEFACFSSGHSVPLYPGGPKPKPSRQFLSLAAPKAGDILTVLISHVEAPDHFYVQQMNEDTQYLSNLMCDLQATYNKETGDLWTVLVPQKGQICVAKYHMDENWYRAEVIELPGRRQVVVRYVDYGNTETVPFFKLKKIHDKFLMLPAQALLCTLADVEPVNEVVGWSQECLKEVIAPFLDKPLVITVEGLEAGKVKVLLYDSGQRDLCMNRLMVQKGHAKSTGPGSREELQLIPQKLTPPSKVSSHERCMKAAPTDPPLPQTSSARASPNRPSRQPPMPTASPIRPDSAAAKPAEKPKPVHDRNRPKQTEVRVSHVISPGHLYIQLATAPADGLDNLMISLQEKCAQEAPTQVAWQPGDFCLAKYSKDERWYRAKILNIPAESTLEVIMVDFGFHDSISTSHVRQLEITDLPTFCIRCHFTDIQPAGDITRWSRTSCEYLTDLLKESVCFIVQKGDMEDGSLPVDLLIREENPGDALNPEMTEYNSVSRKLLTQGLALPIRGVMRRVRHCRAEIESAPLSKPPRPLILDPMTPAAFYPEAKPEEAAESSSKSEASAAPAKPDTESTEPAPKEEVPEVQEVKDSSVKEASEPVTVTEKDDLAKATKVAESKSKPETEEMVVKLTDEDEGRIIPAAADTDDGPPQVDTETKAQADPEGNQVDSGPHESELSPESAPEAETQPGPQTDSVELTKSHQKNQDGFAPPDFPEGPVIKVVPTYVDWDATVFVQYTAEPESSYGRFGHMLKEYTLETILQDKFLASKDRYRGCIPRDGNCLFRAWAEAIYSNQTKQDELRQDVVRYLSNNWSKFEASIVETSKEKYLVEMAKAGTYGGEPEIQALCMLHNRRCLIYLGGLGCPVQTREYGVPLAESDGDVELIYISDECYDNGHYDLAVKDLIKVAQMEAIYALWREAKIKDMPKTFFKEDNQNYDESLLAQLVDYLQKYYKDSTHNPDATYSVGQAVIVLDRDENYYRAHIQDITDKGFKVFLVDFGITDVVPITRLRDKVILQDIPVQCVGCILTGIVPHYSTGRWSQEALEYLHDLVVNKQCAITVQEPQWQEPSFSPHDAYKPGQLLRVSMTLYNGVEIAEHLVATGMGMEEGAQLEAMLEPQPELEPEPRVQQELFVPEEENEVPVKSTMMVGMPVENVMEIIAQRKVGSMYTPMEEPSVAEVLPVSVTSVHAPDKFCIQRIYLADAAHPRREVVNSELDKLMEFTQRMNEEAETYPAVAVIKPGLACCAQYSADLRWYRAEVLVPRTDDNLVGVLFVDYGNSEYVEPSRVRALPKELLTLPMQSLACQPSGVMRPSDDKNEWMKTIKYRVEQLLNGVTLIARVVSVSPEVSVQLFRHDAVEASGTLEGLPSALQPLAEEGLIVLHTETGQDGVLIEAKSQLDNEVD